MSNKKSNATILVVDDEQTVVESYAIRLGMRYDDVHTANSGEEAINVLDVNDVDVVLLDRRMPGMSGDEVANTIEEEGYGSQVIMVTAIDPDFSIVEIPFDNYLKKPIDKEEMFSAVDQQLTAGAYEGERAEYYRIRSKMNILENHNNDTTLRRNEVYNKLLDEAKEYEDAIANSIEEFEPVSER
jgi:response regulator RpfG family c-di-GMP phosphodiesterase